MSTENQTQNQPQTTAKASPLEEVTDKASAKLHSLENQFVSLSSQRQLNFILGALFLLSALTGGIGILIALFLGVLLIFQGVTGNMVLNNFLDTMDQKHKKWLVPGFLGALVLFMILSILMGFSGAPTSA